ncbi:proline dehydrogenase family protein [Mesobacillus maritimus]|uniref:proline dehydrogenase family protein n=1 Tax=Mesobacillus maritimus TaxID=1643336 RepID=UPI00203BE312|nr:proline dehydrogenase family protein [Mesobacillus maritimus]MCM3670305.1 proline dehydrogenase family protein [Mesobacillus maritimus]
MEKWLRNFFLYLSQNRMMTRLAKKYGLRLGAARFVAGSSLEEAVEAIKALNEKGLAVTVDYLGEFIDNKADTVERVNQCIKMIEVISKEKLDAQLSVKLTSMGLDLSRELALENMKKILSKAEECQVFVTIDMEDYSRCQMTIDIFKELRQQYDYLGTVIQAYLYRAQQDIQDLKKLKPHLRLVKGAYKESPEVAFPVKKDVDENLIKLIKMHMLNGNYTAVASHDDRMIEETIKFVKEKNIPLSQFEFQMLYGIRPERQQELADKGYLMRVYLPYGTDWYGYFMRRLAERPANVWFVIKGLIKK